MRRLASERRFRVGQRRPRFGGGHPIKQAVMAGMGISLLSLHTLSLELRTGEIALLDVTGTPIERIWHVAHMSSKRLSPASESCRAYLLEHTAEFLGKEYGGLMPGRRVA
ncbi:LysR substrate-binding domain-containing protein [Cupriavidus sp. GA3-3]|uniref:LysR substrate-binding domain-containing protein n=1 Tax=Cupriavidus sp. GA3-3 TaxID=1229514 RepID=UPI0009DB731D|nr:LysR substrate-binding domain-containing protein [Cupriavidus sp. GA3-3]